MSLILEALKKSEAERRVGQPPGLLSPVIATAPPRRAAWRWVALAAVPVLLLGAWWFGRQSAPEAPPAALSVADAPGAVDAEVQLPQREAAPARSAAEPQPAPQAARTEPPVRTVPALRVPPAPGAESGAMERESEAMSAEAAEALLRAQMASPPPATQRVVPPPSAAPREPTEPARPATAVVESEPPAAAVERLPELRSLTPALRADLPPLKVSMHVYDADPARRFAIIDGRRVAEGDVLGRELWLVEIRREGSVLRYRDERFLLPRPG